MALFLRSIIVLGVLILGSTGAMAAENKVGVFIQFAGKDPVGKQLDFFLRERFRESPTFVEVFDEKQSGFALYLTTLDPTLTNTGLTTSYSFVVTVENENAFNGYITSFVGICGATQLTGCATELFGNVGSTLEDIRRRLAAAAATSSR
jgi:hypothetical protein